MVGYNEGLYGERVLKRRHQEYLEIVHNMLKPNCFEILKKNIWRMICVLPDYKNECGKFSEIGIKTEGKYGLKQFLCRK